MIGRLQGTVLDWDGERLVVSAGGVGFEVAVPAPLGARLGRPRTEVDLYVHTHFHDRGVELYGFSDRRDREVFRRLISVAGVGPKVALAVLSTLDVPSLARAVASGDEAALTRVPGVGKKTAKRLAMELKEPLKEFAVGVPVEAEKPAGGEAFEARAAAVRSALVNMGFRPKDADVVVQEVQRRAEGGESLEELLRIALDLVSKTVG